MKPVVQELDIAAPPDVAYELVHRPTAFGEWMAADATLETAVGGGVRWTHPHGDTVSGGDVDAERSGVGGRAR